MCWNNLNVVRTLCGFILTASFTLLVTGNAAGIDPEEAAEEILAAMQDVSSCNALKAELRNEMKPIQLKSSLQSKRIELLYYRNAAELITILNGLPISKSKGCATFLPFNNTAVSTGVGVGRGGGNVLLLHGEKDYINTAHRFISALDLPLPGVDLELWGIQISSENPEKLADVMIDVRSEIDQTQQLMKETFVGFQEYASKALKTKVTQEETKVTQEETKVTQEETKVTQEFKSIVTAIGYPGVINSSRELSSLDVALFAHAAKDPVKYYQGLYETFASGKIEHNLFVASNPKYQKYFDALRQQGDIGKPAFENFFRSRGLKPKCQFPETLTKEQRCEMWTWESQSNRLAEKIAKQSQIRVLNFAFQYAHFRADQNKFNPSQLQHSADILNSDLHVVHNAFRKDVGAFFVKPTLDNIRARVRREKKVAFAQVGQSTISTLSGVPTTINSESVSAFQSSQPRDFSELIIRANEISDDLTAVIPQVPLVGNNTVDVVSAGEILPVSTLVGLAVALTEQRSKAGELTAGTELSFTPGVLRDMRSAELNIQLKVVDPTFKATVQTGENFVAEAQPFSRVGEQTLRTTVYTQASDLFELSTFTSQATLDGGRAFFPLVGQLWHAVFSGVPGLGRLFSYPRGNQNVLHESLLLTNSLIRPTPLGLGLLYPPDSNDLYLGDELNKTRAKLKAYVGNLNSAQPSQSAQ